jgi:hypothetical protein
MKATGHGYVGCEVYVVGSRPRPDDNDHRCGPGSVLASSAFLAARSSSSGGQPVGPANGRQPARRVAMRTPPVAGPRRCPWRWPSQTDQESRHMKATGHGYASCEVDVVGSRPRPDDNDHRCGGGSVLASSALLAARSSPLRGQPVGPANGRQPARRVAMRARPAAGSRR